MVAFQDAETGEVYQFTDASEDGDDGGIFGTGVELSDLFGAAAEGVATGGVLDVDFGQGGAARGAGETFGDWLEDITGMGGGGTAGAQQPAGQGGGGFGLPQIPGGSQNGGQVGIPQMPGGGSGGQMGPAFAGGGAGASGGVSNAVARVGMKIATAMANNPGLLAFVAERLNLSRRKGHPSHMENEHPKCVAKLVEYLPEARREALEQYLCGLKGPMAGADKHTFLVCMLANMQYADVESACCSCG